MDSFKRGGEEKMGGTFLARAYFDLFHLFVASAAILKVLYRRGVALQGPEAQLQPAPVVVEEAVFALSTHWGSNEDELE